MAIVRKFKKGSSLSIGNDVVIKIISHGEGATKLAIITPDNNKVVFLDKPKENQQRTINQL
jgi:sRNA-binding carbon storage regulator CsrA